MTSSAKLYHVTHYIVDVATFFKGWSWLQFNNLGLVLGVALTFYTSVAKGL